jgi:hypothetical protein
MFENSYGAVTSYGTTPVGGVSGPTASFQFTTPQGVYQFGPQPKPNPMVGLVQATASIALTGLLIYGAYRLIKRI